MFSYIIIFGSSLPELLGGHSLCAIICGRVLTAGDLFVSLNGAKHRWFRREAANVLLDVAISLSECGLGTKVDIPTISDGFITLSIPPGTTSGMKLRLRGKGIRDRRAGERGDMFAVLKVIGPKDIDDRTRELLEELQSIEKSDCREGLWRQETAAAW
jgi:curved DNA-binding protein